MTCKFPVKQQSLGFRSTHLNPQSEIFTFLSLCLAPGKFSDSRGHASPPPKQDQPLKHRRRIISLHGGKNARAAAERTPCASAHCSQPRTERITWTLRHARRAEGKGGNAAFLRHDACLSYNGSFWMHGHPGCFHPSVPNAGEYKAQYEGCLCVQISVSNNNV